MSLQIQGQPKWTGTSIHPALQGEFLFIFFNFIYTANFIYNLSWAEAFMFWAVLGRDLCHLSLVRWQAWLWVVVLYRSYQLPLIVEAKPIMHKIMTFLETSRDLLSSFLDLVFEKSNATYTNYFIIFLQIIDVTLVFSK